MGLELPSELTEPLGWIGLVWPQADEELLFQDGQRWMSFGMQLQDHAQQGDAAAQQVWAQHQGEAIAAFEQFWTEDDGPPRRLLEDAEAALIIGAALIAFAVVTLAMKIAFIVQLVILIIQVAQAIAAAFATFGATTAAIPGFVAMTRVFCRQLLKQIVDHVQTVIKALLTKARALFRKVASRAARKAEREAAEKAAKEAAEKAAKEAAEKAAKEAAEEAAEKAALEYATSPAKLDHVFADKHNFQPLVEQFGSREAVVQEFLTGLRGRVPAAGRFEQTIVVGGQNVVVRGAVVDGVIKIGTAFTP